MDAAVTRMLDNFRHTYLEPFRDNTERAPDEVIASEAFATGPAKGPDPKAFSRQELVELQKAIVVTVHALTAELERASSRDLASATQSLIQGIRALPEVQAIESKLVNATTMREMIEAESGRRPPNLAPVGEAASRFSSWLTRLEEKARHDLQQASSDFTPDQRAARARQLLSAHDVSSSPLHPNQVLAPDFSSTPSSTPKRDETPEPRERSQYLKVPTSRGPTDPNQSLAPRADVSKGPATAAEPRTIEQAAELVSSLESVNEIAAAVAPDFKRLSAGLSRGTLSPGEAAKLKARISAKTLELARPPSIPPRVWNEVIAHVEQTYPRE
jgi:hypothetical protein